MAVNDRVSQNRQTIRSAPFCSLDELGGRGERSDGDWLAPDEMDEMDAPPGLGAGGVG